MINKIALLISHNVFLTNNQINELIEKNITKCLGVSLPVWVNSKNAKTTEPASEIFCEYEIVNENEKDEHDIKITKNGYKIFISKSSWKPPKPMIDTSEMSQEERSYYERKRERWWKTNPEQMDIDSIKKSNYFRAQIKKLDQEFSKLNAIVDVQHSIEIKKIECLIDSLA